MDYVEAENALLREALRASRIAVCVTDGEGRVVQTAGDFAECIGSTDQRLLGSNLRLQLPASLFIPGLAGLLDLDAGDTGVEGQLRHNGMVERMLLFQARTTILAGERFRVITAIDVADFGASRARLSDLQDTLHALASAVSLADAQAPDMPLAFVNRRFEQLTGYLASECIGRNCRFLQGPDTDPAAVEAMRRAIRLRQATQIVLRNYRKNGEAFDHEVYLSPLFDEVGRLRWIIAVSRERRERTLAVPA